MNETINPLIGYATAADSLPSSGSALTYLLAGNGIFVSAIRPGIQVLMPVCLSDQRIKGLPHLTPHLTVSPRIPKELLLEVWRSSCNACTESNVEILFHFHNQEDRWNLRVPEQTHNQLSAYRIGESCLSSSGCRRDSLPRIHACILFQHRQCRRNRLPNLWCIGSGKYNQARDSDASRAVSALLECSCKNRV